MTPFQISHPHAQTAMLLASFNQQDRPWVNRMLAESGTPRRLYTLARVLRAAQTMDEIEAMHAEGRRLRAAIAAKHEADQAALRERLSRAAPQAEAA